MKEKKGSSSVCWYSTSREFELNIFFSIHVFYQLDEVMEKETYKRAKEILERFDPSKKEPTDQIKKVGGKFLPCLKALVNMCDNMFEGIYVHKQIGLP